VTARSPYLLNVRDLIRSPGEMREKHLDIAAPEHLGEGMVSVREGGELDIDVKLESLHEGILASGSVLATAEGECARCLAPVTIPLDVEFAELFAYPSDEPYDHQLEGDQLDLESVVRDAVVLALPFRPECAGGCEDLDLGPDIRLITEDVQQEEPADPRWAALQGFTAAGSDGVGAAEAPKQ
jgi:uncharacterized protein